MPLLRPLLPTLLALAMAAFSLPATSAETLSPAVEINRAVNVVEALHTQLADLMLSDETDLEARKDFIGPTLIQAFDLPAMTKAIFGSRAWRDLNKDQHQQAIDAFSGWMITQYASRFTSSSDPQFLTRQTRDGGRNTLVVETQLRTRKKVVSLDYRTRAKDGVVQIIDVFLDGRVSEVALRKSEFRQVIKDEGFEGFITAMNAKKAALTN